MNTCIECGKQVKETVRFKLDPEWICEVCARDLAFQAEWGSKAYPVVEDTMTLAEVIHLDTFRQRRD